VVSFTTTISGPVGDFDESAYKSSVAVLIGIEDLSKIDVVIDPARRRARASRRLSEGFTVLTSIRATTQSIANAYVSQIPTDAATLSQSLSGGLGATLTVTSIVAVPTISAVVIFSSPSPPPSPPLPLTPWWTRAPPFPTAPNNTDLASGTSSQAVQSSSSDGGGALGIGIGLAAVGVVALCVGAILVYKKRKTTSTIVKAVPVESAVGAASATCTTTAGATAVEMAGSATVEMPAAVVNPYEESKI